MVRILLSLVLVGWCGWFVHGSTGCSRVIPEQESSAVAENTNAATESTPDMSTTAETTHQDTEPEHPPEPNLPEPPQDTTSPASETPHPDATVSSDESSHSEPPTDSPTSESSSDEPTLPPLQDGMKVKVRTVVDGDTVYVYPSDGKNWPYYKIRLWGFNAPECYKGSSGCYKDQEYFGLQAYQTLQSMLNTPNLVLSISCPIKGQTGQTCSLDPYDRYLAYLVLPNGDNSSIKMLTAGLGWVYTIFYPPLLKELCQAEAHAIRNKLGMWSQGREFVKNKMNTDTQDWYYHKTASKAHDKICSDALGQSFATLAGE